MWICWCQSTCGMSSVLHTPRFIYLFSSARRKVYWGLENLRQLAFCLWALVNCHEFFFFAVSAELTNVSRKYEQLMSDYHDLLTSNDQQKNTQVTEIHWVTAWEEVTAILHYLFIYYLFHFLMILFSLPVLKAKLHIWPIKVEFRQLQNII